MGNFLAKVAVIDFAIQWSMWILATLLKTEKFYDLIGSLTFITLSLLSLTWNGRPTTRQKTQTAAICVWATRLGLFLFHRVMKSGADRRFNKVRDNPRVFFVYWTVQGLWILITLLPTLIMNSKTKHWPLQTRDYAGWTLWGIGFLLEMMADYQKSSFNSNPANRNKWIDTGLWSLCRHPNYLGDVLLWFGLYLPASSSFESIVEHASIVSPLFVAWLLTQVSGIPILERQARKKWGRNPDYQAYVRTTSTLIPFLCSFVRTLRLLQNLEPIKNFETMTTCPLHP